MGRRAYLQEVQVDLGLADKLSPQRAANHASCRPNAETRMRMRPDRPDFGLGPGNCAGVHPGRPDTSKRIAHEHAKEAVIMNATRNTRKAGRGKPMDGSRRAAGQSQRNAKAPASNPKQGRGDRNADPQTNYKRYMELARDAASAGDAVQSEYYHQYADHYHRLIADG